MNPKKILFLSHDANRAGSQLLLLKLLRILKKNDVPMHLLLADGGVIEPQFEEVLPVTRLAALDEAVVSPFVDSVLRKVGAMAFLRHKKKKERSRRLQKELRSAEIGLVFVNSIANAMVYREELAFLHHLPVVLFAHELEMSASIYTDRRDLDFLLKRTDHLIAVAKAVAEFYVDQFGFPKSEVSIITLIDHDEIDNNFSQVKSNPLQTVFELPKDALVVGGCGNAEWRKGNDVFNWIAQITLSKTKPLPVYFVWVGADKSSQIYSIIQNDIERMGLKERIILVPPTPNALDYIARFDVMLLTSREDPYPLVVMEAALHEIPTVCFEGAGGAPELVENDAGYTVPYMDIPAAAEAVIKLVIDPSERIQKGQSARKKVLARHKTGLSIERITAIIQKYITLPVSEKT